MSDHEHRAYEVWDGDSRWAPASLERTVSDLQQTANDLETRIRNLEEQAYSLEQRLRS
jgi:hypothetical protein